MDAVKDAGLTGIDHLITTHWHGDHFGGSSYFQEKYGAKVGLTAGQVGNVGRKNAEVRSA